MKRKILFFGSTLMALTMFSSLTMADNQSSANATPSSSPHVILDTSKGQIEIELDTENAPITSKNFINYVNNGFYDGLTFHRVIPNFMIQGGGFNEKMEIKTATNPPIKNESCNEHASDNNRGTVSMARTSAPDSATSQFFINVVNNDFLNCTPDNPGYAVFAKVVKGMDVVDSIAAVSTHSVGPFQDVPQTPITIISAKIKK